MKHLSMTLVCSAIVLSGSAVAQDLNLNAVEDPRDLREGTSPDCNLNGTVDERDAVAPHFTQAIEHLNSLDPNFSQNNVFDTKPIDFNQDGLPDVVVASMISTNVGGISFWRNEGGPGLVHVQQWQLPGTRPYVLRVGDLNADKMQDFIAADASFNLVHVFLATGPETFADPVQYPGIEANNGSVGVDLADIDLDGDLDFAFTTWYPGHVNVYFNNGDGTFAAGTPFESANNPRDLDIADFTGDTLPDIAVANEFYDTPGAPGTVSLYANQGDGIFAFHAFIEIPEGGPPWHYDAEPEAVEFADLDHDGDNDLVVSAEGSNNLTIHLNDGTGNFTLAHTFGGFPIEGEGRDVIVVDFDNDGWEDIAWGDSDMHMLGIYRNNEGVIAFHQNFASANYGAFRLGAADFSGDGLTDIVASNDDSKSFAILENLGELNFDATIVLRPVSFPSDPVIADFTNDGLADFAVTHEHPDLGFVFSVYPGIGNGVFSTTSIDNPITIAGVLHPRDVNHDGNMDIIDLVGHTIVRFGNGDGTFQPDIDSQLSTSIRHTIIDINGDGDLDLAWLWSGHPGDMVVSFGSSDGTFGPATEYEDPAEPEAIGAGDITGDGLPEIFSAHRLGVFSIHTNNGDGTFGTRRDIVITGEPSNPKLNAVAVADFDLDSDNDVVVSGQGLHMFFNPGAGDLPEVPVSASDKGASELFVNDIDLDGTPDLFGETGTALVYLNTQGTGMFDIVMQLRHYDTNARFIIVADANSDGRMDVMFNPENGWGNYLFLNLPPGAADANANGTLDACEFLLGDVDGNGFIDAEDHAAFCTAIGTAVGESGFVAQADMNFDGVIDEQDQIIFSEIQPACDGDVVTSETFAPPPDGVTDGADLAYLLGAWGDSPSCADMVTSLSFAPPPDGVVDGADLAFMLGSWGPCD